jgi:flagellar biosynthesis protein FlhA
MQVDIGCGLIRLVDGSQGGGLLERVAGIRRQMAVDLGLVVPAVQIRDDLKLDFNQYVIKIRGVTIASGSLMTDHLPAMDAETALATHLSEVIKRYAHELLTRDEVNNLIRTLKEESPALVEEVVPAALKPGEIQKVLQNLLKEGVSIRDLGTILETLGDYAGRTRDPEVLTEYVRTALARAICGRYAGRDGRLNVITLDPKLEDLIKASPARVDLIAGRLGREVRKLVAAGHAPLILCSPQVRTQVRKIADTIQPDIVVLSHNEIIREAQVESLGMVEAEDR